MFPVSSTILALKQSIQGVLDVEVERQTLQFEGQELQDDYQDRDYDFQPSSRVSLIVAPYPGNEDLTVQVRTTRRSIIFVTVKETMSVEEFKTLVGRQYGLLQELISLARLGVEMQDDSPLSECYLCKDTDVELTVKVEPR